MLSVYSISVTRVSSWRFQRFPICLALCRYTTTYPCSPPDGCLAPYEWQHRSTDWKILVPEHILDALHRLPQHSQAPSHVSSKQPLIHHAQPKWQRATWMVNGKWTGGWTKGPHGWRNLTLFLRLWSKHTRDNRSWFFQSSCTSFECQMTSNRDFNHFTDSAPPNVIISAVIPSIPGTWPLPSWEMAVERWPESLRMSKDVVSNLTRTLTVTIEKPGSFGGWTCAWTTCLWWEIGCWSKRQVISHHYSCSHPFHVVRWQTSMTGSLDQHERWNPL